MKILLISHKHPPSLGGMETQSYYIAKGLAKEHHVIPIVLNGQESKWTFYLNLKNRIKKALSDHLDIDIIHLNDGLMAFLCAWLPSYTDKPIVTTFHGLDLVFPNAIYQRRLASMNRPNFHLITVSHATKDEAIKRGFDASKIHVIPNGVNHDLLSKKSTLTLENILDKYKIKLHQPFIMMSVGRAVPRKGLSWFVDKVMPHVSDDIGYLVISPNNVKGIVPLILRLLPQSVGVKLSTLMGFTTDYRSIHHMIAKHSLKDKVAVIDKVDFGDLVALYEKSNLFIMPNIKATGDMEGFGLVILEANVCNSYALASAIEGITSAVVDNKNGNLIASGNEQEWIQKITNIKDKDHTNLGLKAAEFVKQTYSWDIMVNAYIDLFKTIATKRH